MHYGQIPCDARIPEILVQFQCVAVKFPEMDGTGNFFALAGNSFAESGNSFSLIDFMGIVKTAR
jgi:hypothetical protein